MELETLAIQLQKVDDRSARNEGRIKSLEEDNETLHSLATSVAVMAEQLKTMNSKMDGLSSKVELLESKPGKRWDTLVEKVTLTLVAAIVGFLLARIGVN